MSAKKKLILTVSLLLLIIVFENLLYLQSFFGVYDSYIFHPFQSFRNFSLQYLPFSMGDIFYIVLGTYLIYTIIKAGRYLVLKRKPELIKQLTGFALRLVILYSVYVLGWAANYVRPAITQQWNFYNPGIYTDTAALMSYDSFLVVQINNYKDATLNSSVKDINEKSKNLYGYIFPGSNTQSRQAAKASLWGNMLQRMGTQGYFNPFTGEAQVNACLPGFMLPFVICHEMAHQIGIAAENDANLLAYIVGTESRDSSFIYSAYLNMWLYVNRIVKGIDSNAALYYRAQFNEKTIAHLDTLNRLRIKYRGSISNISANIYDSYLKMNNLKDGLKTYNNVVFDALQWEKLSAEEKKHKAHLGLFIPNIANK